MKILMLAGIAGFFGTILRFILTRYVNHALPGFPWGTLLVNVAGAFIAGFLFVYCRANSRPTKSISPSYLSDSSAHSPLSVLSRWKVQDSAPTPNICDLYTILYCRTFSGSPPPAEVLLSLNLCGDEPILNTPQTRIPECYGIFFIPKSDFLSCKK